MGIDKSRELFQEKNLRLGNDLNNANLILTLQDTVRPFVKSITPKSSQTLTINLSEAIKKISSLYLTEKSSGEMIPVYEYVIDGSMIECVTGITDTNSYLVMLESISDYRDNVTEMDSISFTNTQLPDTTWLVLDSLSHEDGQTVTTLKPEFTIRFNKIIPEDNLSVWLIDTENNKPVELDITKNQGYSFIVKPRYLLNNYVPYSFIINEETSDYEGNTMEEGVSISILPILYD